MTTEYTPATADDTLLEMSDAEMIEAIGSTSVATRADATFPLLKETTLRFGDTPSDATLDRVVDTLVATNQLSIAA